MPNVTYKYGSAHGKVHSAPAAVFVSGYYSAHNLPIQLLAIPTWAACGRGLRPRTQGADPLWVATDAPVDCVGCLKRM